MIRRAYDGPLTGALGSLQGEIAGCRACPRLLEHRERKALRERRRSFAEWEYWGAGVPGHGDPRARLLIVGLAPAAHGANRTGRMFTGDPTAAFLARALHRAGFANQPTSLHRGDGLTLTGAYETAAARCAPPGDRPTREELAACRRFLRAELRLLTEVRAVLALGRVAFDQLLRALSENAGRRVRAAFAHGAVHRLGEGLPVLFACYHPSPRNTNTGRLTEAGLDAVLETIRRFLEESGSRRSR